MAWDLCQTQHFPLPAMTAKQKNLPLFVLQQVGEQPRGALIIQLGKAVVKDDRHTVFSTQKIQQFQTHHQIDQIGTSTAERRNIHQFTALLVLQTNTQSLVDYRSAVTGIGNSLNRLGNSGVKLWSKIPMQLTAE